MKKAWAIPTVVLVMLSSTSALAQEPRVFTGNLAPRSAEYVADRVLVGFHDAVTDAEAAEIVGGLRQGAAMRAKAFRGAFRVLSVPRGRVWQVVSALQSDPRVRYAHPDWIAHALDVPPNDPFYPNQWNLQSPATAGGIRVEGAWAVGGGGDPSVTVAVIDTGIAYESFGGFCQAPDLAGTRFVPGWDFVSGDAHPNDDESHGTHVAGTIAQATNNTIGAAGIAYNVSLMPIKVLGANGSGTIGAIADGIRWAADHGAHVINMSLGTDANPIFLTALQDAVEYAAARGVVIVAASGNAAGATPMYPAAYPEVIAVGASKYNRQLAPYSNRGNELCAPGGTSTGEDLSGDGAPDMILQNTFDPNTHAVCSFGYWYFAGTSMATPHVAALAALVKSEKPELTAAEIRQVLRDTAAPGVDPACGYGLIDATQALESVAGGDRAPTLSMQSPIQGGMVFGNVMLRIAASDVETPPAELLVEWWDGTSWSAAALDAGTGYYEASWNTLPLSEDSQVTLRARATDSIGQMTEVAATVTVNNLNQAPVASFSYTCSSNVCDFDGSGSSDDDGQTRSYAWVFGDGQSGAGTTVRHTFAASGTYTVVLIAMDELGLTGSSSQQVAIQVVNDSLHVFDLDRTSRRLFFGLWEARVTIRVKDAVGSLVSNARVSGIFSDGPSLFQCTTNASGSCTVVGYQWNLPCLTFSVTNVAHATLKYAPAQNADPDGDSNGTQITVCRP